MYINDTFNKKLRKYEELIYYKEITMPNETYNDGNISNSEENENDEINLINI